MCGLRYLVYLGGGIGDAAGRARDRSEMIRATFVDARETPFLECSCGEILTLVDEVSVILM